MSRDVEVEVPAAADRVVELVDEQDGQRGDKEGARLRHEQDQPDGKQRPEQQPPAVDAAFAALVVGDLEDVEPQRGVLLVEDRLGVVLDVAVS